MRRVAAECGKTDGRTDGRTYMTNIIFAFRNFPNATNNEPLNSEINLNKIVKIQ